MIRVNCDAARLLLSDLFAGAAAPADIDALEEHVAGCRACRDYARAQCRVERALGELAGQANLSTLQDGIALALAREPGVLRGRRLVVHVVALALAACLLLALGYGVWRLHPEGTHAPVIARLDCAGEVYIVDGAFMLPARSGQVLRAGQGLKTVGEDSLAHVVFDDGTQLQLSADTSTPVLRETTETEGKWVQVEQGYVSATVTRQPADRPMILETSQARVVVRGTKLHVMNSPRTTRVELEQGSVEVARRDDGQSIEVSAGAFALIGAVGEALRPRPVPPVFKTPAFVLLEGSTRVLMTAVSPDGRLLASGGRDGQVKLWELAAGAEQFPRTLYKHKNSEVRSVRFSADGKRLATGGDDLLVKLFDLDQRRQVGALRGHSSWIEWLEFFRTDPDSLIVAGAHGKHSSVIRLWDLPSGEIRHTFEPGHKGGTWVAALSRDEKLLGTCGRDGSAKIWDIASGELVRSIQAHSMEAISLAFSPDGRWLATGSRDKTVKIWDIATGREVTTLIAHAHDVRSLAFTPDGKFLASGSMDGTVRLWDMADFHARATLKHKGGIWSVGFTPDGQSLIASGNSKSIAVWRLADIVD